MQATLQQPHRAPDGAPVHYERHRPEQTRLYRLVQQHAATFFAQAEDAAGADLPQFVKGEFALPSPSGSSSLGLACLAPAPETHGPCQQSPVRLAHQVSPSLLNANRALKILSSVGLVAAFIAPDENSQVLGLVSNAWAGFGAAFGPLIILSLMWPRTNGAGAIAGMVVGAATVMIWIALGWNVEFMGGPGVYEIILGFIASFIAILAVSSATADAGEYQNISRLKESA